MIWFTSDTHFGHANIIKYCARPFSDVQEMNREMVRLWNDTVAPLDSVYHLGDFAFGNIGFLRRVLASLNGRVTLVRGNHDGSAKKMVEVGFAYVYESLFYESLEHGRVLMTHKPLGRPSGLDETHQLCGHVHEKWRRRGMTINVGVDQWGFRPQSLEALLDAKESA